YMNILRALELGNFAIELFFGALTLIRLVGQSARPAVIFRRQQFAERPRRNLLDTPADILLGPAIVPDRVNVLRRDYQQDVTEIVGLRMPRAFHAETDTADHRARRA